MVSPVPIGQQHDLFAAGLVVALDKRAANLWLHAKRDKPIEGDLRSVDRLTAPSVGQMLKLDPSSAATCSKTSF